MNYDSMAAMAEKLISDTGRNITLRKVSKIAADPAKPWRGIDTSASVEVVTKGVFVDLTPMKWGHDITKGDETTRKNECFIVAGTSDFEDFDEIDDNGTVYKITDVKELRPGERAIVYYIEVRR